MGQMSLRFATEVRHSLHGMLGFLELAIEEPLSVRQAAYLERCRSGADRLLRIASDLWELSQPDIPPAVRSTFEARTAVEEVIDLVRGLAEHKGLTLECACAAGCEVRIEGPAAMMQDNLRRILDNAILYSERGTIRASASVRLTEDSAAVVFEVADKGPGIPEDILAIVRADDDRLPELGLSLAVVRERMKKMKGEFSVESTPAGTTVRLVMPASPVRIGETGVRAGAKAPPTSPLRILVVEDSDDGYFVFQGYTSDEGHQLTRAYDGAQAVEMAKTGEYDLIVMDANMPVMNGYAATQAIREWESHTGRFARMPILLFSADDPMKQSKLGGAAGCSAYLAKPATKAEVVKALKYFAPLEASRR